MPNIIDEITKQYQKTMPAFGAGDTVRVSVKVVEGTRERIQMFEGVVLQRRSGGITENFTVRRIGAHGIGVERTFPLHSPSIDKIEVVRFGIVRRANLYYLRDRTGKAARIKERRVDQMSRGTTKTIQPVTVPAEEVAAEPVEA